MSKRRMESGLDSAINMDVMMDNMTDVVGTLLMVLIIVQLKVNTTIDTIQSNLPNVTQGQVTEAQQQAVDLQKSAEVAQLESQKQVPDKAKIAAEIQAKQVRLRQYETTLLANSVTLIPLDRLKSQLAERQAQIDVAKLDMTKLIDEREKLKGLLQNTPVPVIPPAQIVRLPAARDIPEGAQMINLLCANGRVHNIDTAFMKKMALEAFLKARSSLILTRGPVTPGKDTNIYDHEKTANLLTKRELGNREYKLEFPVIETQNRIHMQIKPLPESGLSLEDLKSPQSRFARFLRVVKRNPRSVVWFLVCSDSFETYLQARETCDQVGVSAGWELSGSPWLAENLYEFETNVITPPPPPAPPVPGAISIPAPKKTID